MVSQKQGLRFSRCKVHFIYSFLVNLQSRSFPESQEKVTSEGRDSKNDNDKTPITRLLTVLKKTDHAWTDSKPKDRIGVTSNLSIRGNEIYWTNPAKNLYLTSPQQESGAKKPLTLSKFVRISDSGASTITLTLAHKFSKNTGITAIDVHNTYNLIGVNAQNDPLFYLSDEDAKESPLFDIFWGLVEEIKKKIESAATSKEKDNLILDEAVRPNCDGAEKRKTIEWQNPFILTELTLAKNFAFDKYPLPPWASGPPSAIEEGSVEPRSRVEHQELITIWARFLKGKGLLEKNEQQYVQTRPADEPTRFPTNYSWHKDVFIGYHGRGGTVMHYPKPRDSAIVEELTESYLDLMETLRARWHLCVLFGELISKDLDHLTTLKGDNLFTFTEVMIRRREMFIRFLADQTMYAFEGGVVSEICRKARNDLYIDMLTSAVKDKFTALERYFRECVDLTFNK